MQMGCKTINFDRFRGNTANKGFCRVRIDLQNAVVILVLRFATLQNKLATAVFISVIACCKNIRRAPRGPDVHDITYQ
jgi:hypothetical protein